MGIVSSCLPLKIDSLLSYFSTCLRFPSFTRKERRANHQDSLDRRAKAGLPKMDISKLPRCSIWRRPFGSRCFFAQAAFRESGSSHPSCPVAASSLGTAVDRSPWTWKERVLAVLARSSPKHGAGSARERYCHNQVCLPLQLTKVTSMGSRKSVPHERNLSSQAAVTH